jgi:hypothetical protein
MPVRGFHLVDFMLRTANLPRIRSQLGLCGVQTVSEVNVHENGQHDMYKGANMGTVISSEGPVVPPLIPNLLFVLNVCMFAYRHPNNYIIFNSL